MNWNGAPFQDSVSVCGRFSNLAECDGSCTEYARREFTLDEADAEELKRMLEDYEEDKLDAQLLATEIKDEF